MTICQPKKKKNEKGEDRPSGGKERKRVYETKKKKADNKKR